MGVMKGLNTLRMLGKTPRFSRAGSDGFHVDFYMFVDRSGVMDRVEKKRLRVLARTGAYTRSAMQRSIKHPKASKKARTIRVGKRDYHVPVVGWVVDAKSKRRVTTEQAERARKALERRIRRQGVGQPPHRGPSDLLRKYIFFGVEPETESVVVGPLMFASQPRMIGAESVPELLEKGGRELVGGKFRRYAPRPFVERQRPLAEEKMRDLIRTVPL